MKFSPLEMIFVAVIVALLVVLLIGAAENKRKFTAACDRAKGTTVYDGRHYQCIKEVTNAR